MLIQLLFRAYMKQIELTFGGWGVHAASSPGNVGTDGTLAGSTEIAYSSPVTGPMTKMVLPDGSSKSNVLAPHSSFFGGRKTSTFELHSR
jgi:hypothetical protein